MSEEEIKKIVNSIDDWIWANLDVSISNSQQESLIELIRAKTLKQNCIKSKIKA